MVSVITRTNGAAMLATPAPVDTQPTMCLLHGDFHVMEQACWSLTMDFYFDHQGVPEQEARNLYLTAVERKMLDSLLPAVRPTAP